MKNSFNLTIDIKNNIKKTEVIPILNKVEHTSYVI